ncbi:hypothetical protein ACFV1L_06275 [Kitasatospora sp. NPDC059646]|uniref:hypothetical protein n=1 Tax=Kitasatospora sp. NPDC059646 TaxID=3346893 RepID=UPI00367368E4
MADETTTLVPEAERTGAPVEHLAEPTDQNAIERAFEVLAGQPAAPAVERVEEPVAPNDDEKFEPLGTIPNTP